MFASGDGRSSEAPRLELDAGVEERLYAHNELAVRGWMNAPGGDPSVKVRIGGRELTAALRPEASRVRFELTLDTADWGRGLYPLEVVATAGNRSTVVATTVDLLPYRPPPIGEEAVSNALAGGAAAMWYEAPELAGGVVADEYPEVRGWATAGDGIDSVLVTVDERLRLRAIHGLDRSDLRAGFGDEIAADCGFALRLDASELPPGQHVLTIVTVTRGGDAIGIAGTVDRVEPATGHGRIGDGQSPSKAPAAEEPRDHLASGERFVPELHRGTSLEPEHHARYRWAAPLVEGLAVLDAGCGVGWGAALLAERASAVTGVDISPLAISESRRRHGDVADFEPGDLCDLPFDDAAFDAVACFEAIEHVADLERALDELRRVLRPGGLLLVSSPNRGVYPAGNPFHVHELTAAELEESLRRRFANAAVYRQQSYVASLVGTEAQLALDDPAAPLDAAIAKLVGGPPGSELYTVAAASDGALPTTPSLLALGDELDREEHLRMLAPWRSRAERAEIELAQLRAAARAAARRIAQLERELGRS